jgi:hypothetical protein
MEEMSLIRTSSCPLIVLMFRWRYLQFGVAMVIPLINPYWIVQNWTCEVYKSEVEIFIPCQDKLEVYGP